MSSVFKTFIIFCFFLMDHINRNYVNQELIYDEPDELEWEDIDEDEDEDEDFEFDSEYILWLLNDFFSTLVECNVEQLFIFIFLIHVILKDLDKEEQNDEDENS